jgi:hypothetical protein
MSGRSNVVDDEARRIEVKGERELVDQLGPPLRSVLGRRRRLYRVRLESLGRCGEVLVAIDGTKGHLPLIFGSEHLEPGYVAGVVQQVMERFAL